MISVLVCETLIILYLISGLGGEGYVVLQQGVHRVAGRAVRYTGMLTHLATKVMNPKTPV